MMLFVAPQTWGEYTRRERGQERRREYTVYSGCSALLTMSTSTLDTNQPRHTLIRSFSRDLIYKHLCHFPHNLKPSYLSKTGTEVQKLLAVALKVFKYFSTWGKIFCLIEHSSSWIDHDLYFCIRNIKVFLPRVSLSTRLPSSQQSPHKMMSIESPFSG